MNNINLEDLKFEIIGQMAICTNALRKDNGNVAVISIY